MSTIDKRRRQLEAQKEEMERDFPVKINLQLSYRSGFIGGGGEVIVLSFILGALATGFFQEIGKDFWLKAKEFCGGIVKEQERRQDQSSMTVLVTFDYQGHQILAKLNLDRKRLKAMYSLYGIDPVSIFWEQLPSQASQIVESIEMKSEDLEGMKAISLELSDKHRKWVLRKTEASA
jgi:hypothetical protein